MRKLHAAGLASTLAAALVLSACGTEESDQLDQQSAQAIGGALAAQIEAIPASFTASGVAEGSVGGGFFSPRARPTALWAAPGLRPLLNNRACDPTVDDVTDGDGDGVPDDATVTFTQANCTTGSFYITGTIGLVDPSPTAVGYVGTFTNLLLYLGLGGTSFASIELDGSHGVLGTPNSATLSENVVTTIDAQDNGQTLEGTLANNWTIQFDAAVGEAIVMDDLLPDGDFAANGTFTYDINGERFVLSIQTQTALAYDADCALEFPFSDGEVRARLGGPNGQVYVKISYNGCGQQPSVEFFGRNS